MSAITPINAQYSGNDSLYTPLKDRVDRWNLTRQLDAAQMAIDVLLTPTVKEECGDQVYTAVLAGYRIHNDKWKSKTYELLERGKKSEDGDVRSLAQSIDTLSSTIVSDHYGADLPRKIDEFALAHAKAYEADGNGRFWKRQGWFADGQFGKACKTLQKYGIPVQLTP
jgi:hypothetical protein